MYKHNILFIGLDTHKVFTEVAHIEDQGSIKDRTALINRLRGLLAEFGIIMPKERYLAQKATVGI